MVPPSNNSYAPPKSVVADVMAGESGADKASVIARLGGAIIDGLVLGIPFLPCYALALDQTPANPVAVWSAMVATGGWFYVGVAAAVCSLTLTAIFVHRNGQTIGKKLVGIKVARSDESRATVARIFWLRYLVNTLLTLIPVIGSLYGLVDVLMIFGRARRCCHDYIADTIVIRA